MSIGRPIDRKDDLPTLALRPFDFQLIQSYMQLGGQVMDGFVARLNGSLGVTHPLFFVVVEPVLHSQALCFVSLEFLDAGPQLICFFGLDVAFSFDVAQFLFERQCAFVAKDAFFVQVFAQIGKLDQFEVVVLLPADLITREGIQK